MSAPLAPGQEDRIGPYGDMDAISGLLVTLGVSLVLVDSTGRQLPLQKLLPRVLAASVVLLRVTVCQNDFQVVPAIASLNCSNITNCT